MGRPALRRPAWELAVLHGDRPEQTSPLSVRHIAGVRLAEKSGAQRTRDRYLWDFTLFTSPISRHPKSAYVWQGFMTRFVPPTPTGRVWWIRYMDKDSTLSE